VSPAAADGHISDLATALDRLYDVRLVEELRDDRLRLHPLVREFAADLTPKGESAEFRHACARRVVQAFDLIAAWEGLTFSNGIDELELCLTTARDFASSAEEDTGQTISSWLRIVRRESHNLRGWDPKRQPDGFAQRILFRSTTFGDTALA